MSELNDAKVEATVDGIPPRGDLIRETAKFVGDNMRPQIVVVEDPLSGTKAPLILVRDSDGDAHVNQLSPTVFDGYTQGPRLRAGTAILTSIQALIDHANRFKDEGSAIFANEDRAKPSITAVLDYSWPNVSTDEGIGVAPPRFGRHRSHINLPLSDEWKAWNGKNGVKMSVADFAVFLEDRIADIAGPGELPLSEEQQKYIDRIGGQDRIATVTDLVTLSKGLRVNENASFTSALDISSGQGEVFARVEHTDTAGVPLQIPTSFQIAIPVFRNDGYYVVVARLRYKVNGGAMQLWYDLWGVDKVFDHAFKMAVDKVQAETELPVFLGAPES